MRYLITGSTGVCGKYLIEHLLNTCHPGDQIVAVSRQYRYFYDDHPHRNSALLLECYADLRHDPIRLITQFQPNVVLHCAGEGRQAAPPRDIWRANVDTTLNLLEACKLLDNTVKFLYCSSIVVNDMFKTIYSSSKLAGEHLVESYALSNKNIVGISVRFPAVSGAGNKHGVVKDVVSKLLDDSKNKLNLLTNSRKPFVFAEQLAETMLHISENTIYPRIFTISPINSIFVSDIVTIAMQKTGINKDVVWNSSWEGDSQKVDPPRSDYLMYNSETAIELAIDDILREDYGYVAD